MSAEGARQPKGVRVGGQFAATAKSEPDVALNGFTPALGSWVETSSRGFTGDVTEVHSGCPMGAAWRAGQEIPIRSEALEPGYPWYSVKLHGGRGAVCVPHYDIAGAGPAQPASPELTETERLRAAAQASFDALMAADPRAGHALWEALQADVAGGEYPVLQVGQGDDGNAVFLDPDTGQQTHLIAEDVSFRWNRADNLDAGDKVVAVFYDGSSDHEALLYRSGATNEPVRLPEGWTEEAT